MAGQNPPDIAVVSAPGRSLARIHAPYVGGYAEYCDRAGPRLSLGDGPDAGRRGMTATPGPRPTARVVNLRTM